MAAPRGRVIGGERGRVAGNPHPGLSLLTDARLPSHPRRWQTSEEEERKVTTILPERIHRQGVWTDDYCLRHCQGYRVCGPDGTVGYVEEVRLSPEDDTVEALLVRRTDGYQTFTVPRGLVEDVDAEADCLWIGRPD
jgi:sporulation protein YlmC with PRC-barrel domain